MCGITGIFSYSNSAPPVDEAELLQIRESMTNRGPDGAGLWISENKKTGLAHRRLSIIDLSKSATQPMATRDGRLQIVFNGEIYNYKELTQSLKAKGYSFASTSDTEVLLHLYSEYGEDMVNHIRGMYAFAIWDIKKQALFLARDPFGIKPLYYSDNGNTFRFASQVKALLKSNSIDKKTESAGRVGFFLWGYVPEPYTLYKNIKSLSAGTTLWVDIKGPRGIRQYFNIRDEVLNAESLSRGTQYQPEYIKEVLRESIKDSVQHHQIADVDVGLFLSAGLDSTTLTALAAESRENNLHTITLGFEEYQNTEYNETILAAKVAKHYSTHHQTRFLSRNDFHNNLDKLLDAMDQPSIDGVNTYFVSKIAKESGMKVALSGVGGDELFGSYSSFKDVPRMVALFKGFNAIPAIGRAFRYISSPLMKHFTSPKYAGLLEYGGRYSGAYLLRRGLFMPWELPTVLDGETVKEGWRELQPLIHLDESVAGIASTRLNVSALEMTWYMRNQLLRDADWAGMAHSLEIRTPFVDIELFRKLLPHLNSNRLLTKRLMASSVPVKPLPLELINRPKTGFSVPIREWLLSDSDKSARGLRGWAKYISSALVT